MCVYFFRADYLVLDNQLGCSALGRLFLSQHSLVECRFVSCSLYYVEVQFFSSVPRFLKLYIIKYLLILSLWVFFLHVYMCTTCMQCPLRRKENVGSQNWSSRLLWTSLGTRNWTKTLSLQESWLLFSGWAISRQILQMLNMKVYWILSRAFPCLSRWP